MAEHQSDVNARSGGQNELVVVHGNHPVEAEGEVHLFRHTIVASDVRSDIEEGLLVKIGVAVFVP